ncbi:MAG TPA: AbrB/MazE/SpoVT family DNA-binding domain-containing protein [Nitrososphaerales archaeon]|nr:AbrB/MazE/SpoVT family DNA-binding domain-containing protein [Nitrososphaerales archaeon]
MTEEVRIRTRISKGFQVVVPSELRRQYKLDVGDEVIWEVGGRAVTTEFHKKPSLLNIVALGRSGTRGSSVELKKRVQKGDS